jgi:hypothetical protein
VAVGAVSDTTIFTCSVYADLTRVWYHFVQRYTRRPRVSVLIYDCGARLTPTDFAGATIVRRPNLDHGRNIDHAVQVAVTPRMFLTDDDSFVVDARAEPTAARLLRPRRTAAVTFRPRTWWQFEIDGRHHPVMGTNALVFKPEIFRRERLSFRQRPASDPSIRNGLDGRYDTGDHANEALLRRGYAVVVPDATVREAMVVGYSGVSRGFLNFARPVRGTAGYRASSPPAGLAAEIVAHASDRYWPLEKLRWACGIAAVIELHRRLFGEPRFSDFLGWDDLGSVATAFPAALRGEAEVLLDASRAVSERLRTAA